MLEPVLLARQLGFECANFVVSREGGICRLLGDGLQLKRLGAFELERGFGNFELGARCLHTDFGDLAFGRPILLAGQHLEQLMRCLVQAQLLQLVAVRNVALGLGSLSLERGNVALELQDAIAHPKQVLLGELHLALGGLLAALVLGDAGRFLDQRAAIFGAG